MSSSPSSSSFQSIQPQIETANGPRKVTTSGHRHERLMMTMTVVEKEKEGHMTGGTGSGRRHNPYQSLDHTQLAENTYYTVMK